MIVRYDSGGSPPGYDRTRGALPGNRGFKLTYLEEAYTTEHWLVRIYRYRRTKQRDELQRQPPYHPVNMSTPRHVTIFPVDVVGGD